jgi:hypothetical protein
LLGGHALKLARAEGWRHRYGPGSYAIHLVVA